MAGAWRPAHLHSIIFPMEKVRTAGERIPFCHSLTFDSIWGKTKTETAGGESTSDGVIIDGNNKWILFWGTAVNDKARARDFVCSPLRARPACWVPG